MNNCKKPYLLFFLFLVIARISLAQSGQIKGRVTDADNNESIPFANIIVVGTQIGSTSDLDGNFIITGLNPGFVNLQVSFIGFKTEISPDIMVSNSTIPFIEINLETAEEALEEVVISVDPFRKNQEAPLSMQSIGAREIENNPGSNRDISRVIQSFPGVGSTPAFRNDIIIRGGGPSENRFFLDGVEIPVLNHFSTQGASGGPVGIINADFIQTVDYYSGSFPANKYNALSGMFDFKQKEGSKDKTNIQAALGASEAALTLDGPMGDKTNYIFSIRRSYLQFLFSALGLPFLPTFNDYQLKVKTNLNQKNQLTIISLGSLDNLALNTGIKDPDATQEFIINQIPVNSQWSYTFGAVHKHFFESGFQTVVLSRNMLNNEFYKYPDNDKTRDKSYDYKSSEAETKSRYELTWRKNGFKYNISVNGEYAKYTNTTSQRKFFQDTIVNFQYTTALDLFKYGASFQVSRRVADNRLLLSFGLRMDGNTYNDKMANPLNQFSPRISLSYSLDDKTRLNAGAGRYFQQPAYTTLGYRDFTGILVNSAGTRYIGANHYNLGFEHRFSDPIIFSIEGFYKKYFQYPIDSVTGESLANQGADYSSVVGTSPVVSTGEGEAIGFEIVNRINYKKFTLLASYTYVRSQFTDIEGRYRPSTWDSKHILILTGSKTFKGNWQVGFKWRFVGGLPYTPYDLETSSKVLAWDARGGPYNDYTKLNSERSNAFHQLDVRIDKNFFFTRWALMFYIDVQNAYNFKFEDQDFILREKNPDGSYMTANNDTEYVLTTAPNLSGSIVPTIGIMIKF